MSEPRPEPILTDLEDALERGDLEAARRLSARAEALLGEHPRLLELRERVGELDRILRESPADPLVNEARGYIQSASYEEAVSRLRWALQIDPRHTEAAELLDRTEKAASRLALAQRREQAVADAARAARAAMAEGNLQLARQTLLASSSEHGRHPELDAVQGELESKLRQDRRAEASRHAGLATELFERRDWRGALHQAQQALALDGDLEAAAAVEANARRELDRLEGERQHAAAIEDARVDVERLIGAGELRRAAQRLGAAVDRFGALAVFTELGGQLDAAKKDLDLRKRIEWAERRANEAEALVRESARVALGGDFGAAVANLEQAQKLDPSHPELEERLATARAAFARHEGERRQEEALRGALTEVRQHLEGLRLPAAAEALRRARERFGDDRRFAALEARLARQREAEQSAGILPTPETLPQIGLAAKSAIVGREGLLASAYTWRQAFLYPFRGAGLPTLGVVVALLLLLDLGTLAGPVAGFAGALRLLTPWLLACVVVPSVLRSTLAGENVPPRAPLGFDGGAMVVLGVILLCGAPVWLLVAARPWHPLLAAQGWPLGWWLLAVSLWLACALGTVAVGVGIAFGGRYAWRLWRHPAALRLAGSTGVFVAGLAFLTVAAAVWLRFVFLPFIPWMGAPFEALLEAYALLALPHWIGAAVRGRRLALAEAYA
ncbi:MAG: hypothetical protein AAGN66_01575 [Acidobacteriota bacterium]